MKCVDVGTRTDVGRACIHERTLYLRTTRLPEFPIRPMVSQKQGSLQKMKPHSNVWHLKNPLNKVLYGHLVIKAICQRKMAMVLLGKTDLQHMMRLIRWTRYWKNETLSYQFRVFREIIFRSQAISKKVLKQIEIPSFSTFISDNICKS